ncbi:hypothetical protein RSAG8_06257, partial [Rhizoctonia solani AG-8 WAC10335]
MHWFGRFPALVDTSMHWFGFFLGVQPAMDFSLLDSSIGLAVAGVLAAKS